MAHLNSLLTKLQLDGIPNLAAKAAQYSDQIHQRFSGSKVHSLNLAKLPVAIQLACESLSVEFNEAAGSTLSALSLREYKKCLHDIRVALGLNKHVTLEELDVRFGPPQGVIDYSRKLLVEFKQSFGATMPLSVSRHMNWADSAYIAGAFALVCKHFKKRVASKADILAIASIKPKVFNNALSKLEEFGKRTLAEIDGGSDTMARTPAKKRVHEALVDAGKSRDASDTVTPTRRGPRAAIRPPVTATATPAQAVPDEIGSIARKRTRTQIEEPTPTATRRTSLRAAAKPSMLPAETPVAQKRRGRPATKTPQTAAAAAVARITTAKREAKATAARPRIGIVSMIQDRDYRDTPLYASYQSWRASVLVN
ncbi:Origin of replication complex subunit 6 [Coemansia sp. IMI 209128]|nr:Origin of replication complex subunit 6 [Coemansia sp. IMI 209128]